jgi:hypothetical protein
MIVLLSLSIFIKTLILSERTYLLQKRPVQLCMILSLLLHIKISK